MLLESIAATVFERLADYDQHWQHLLTRNRAAVGPVLAALVLDGILEGAVPPAGTTYVPRVVGVENTSSLVDYLVETARVQVVPGRFFAAPAHIRIGLGGDHEAWWRASVAWLTPCVKRRPRDLARAPTVPE